MKNTIKNIAASDLPSSARGLFVSVFAVGLLDIAGCSALPSPPSRPVLYDFGPGPVARAPSDRRAPLPPLALADVEAPGLPEGSNAVLYRLAHAAAQGGRLPAVLRVELEEFSHLFASASDSAGVVRLRATVVDLTLGGEALRGQRVFTVRTPARSADAAGGVAALADASTQVAQEVAEWVEQVGR